VGADDHVQQALVLQLVLRIGVGAQQPHLQPLGAGAFGQAFGDALGVAGLAAVEHREPDGRRRCGHRRQRTGRHAARRGASHVAGKPVQRLRVQSFDQARGKQGLFRRERVNGK